MFSRIGDDEVLAAFDAATGKRNWQEPAPPARPTYGDALFSVSGQSGGRFFVVDARTGAQLWRGERGQPRTRSSRGPATSSLP